MEYKKCINCGRDIRWEKDYLEWQHDNGDPQCSDEFGNFLASIAEPGET